MTSYYNVSMLETGSRLRTARDLPIVIFLPLVVAFSPCLLSSRWTLSQRMIYFPCIPANYSFHSALENVFTITQIFMSNLKESLRIIVIYYNTEAEKWFSIEYWNSTDLKWFIYFGKYAFQRRYPCCSMLIDNKISNRWRKL